MFSQSSRTKRFSVVARLLVIGALAFAQTACTTVQRPVPLSVSTQIEAARGFKLHAPTMTLTASGASVRGFVCRGSAVIAPTHVQLERIGVNGEVISTERTRVRGLSGRAAGCTVYSFKTAWAPQAGERLLVCAPRSGRACRTTS